MARARLELFLEHREILKAVRGLLNHSAEEPA